MRNIANRNTIYSRASTTDSSVKIYDYQLSITSEAQYSKIGNPSTLISFSEENYDYGKGPIVGYDAVEIGNTGLLRVVSHICLDPAVNPNTYGCYFNFTWFTGVAPYNTWTTPSWSHNFNDAKAGFRPSLIYDSNQGKLLLGYVNSSGTITIKKSTNYGQSFTTISSNYALGGDPITGTRGALSLLGVNVDDTPGRAHAISWEDPHIIYRSYGRPQQYLHMPRDDFQQNYATWFYQAIRDEPLSDIYEDTSAGSTVYTFCSESGLSKLGLYRRGMHSNAIALYGLDPDFQDHKIMISALNKKDNGRIYATINRQMSSGSGTPYDNEVLLGWTDDGINFAIPENGRITTDLNRGKFLILGDYFYLVSQASVHKGKFLKSFGNTTASSSTPRVLSWEYAATSDGKPQQDIIVNHTDEYIGRKSVEIYLGNDLYCTGISDKIAKTIGGDEGNQAIVSRGISGLLNNYHTPMADVLDIWDRYSESLKMHQGGLAMYKGMFKMKDDSYIVYSNKVNEECPQLAIAPMTLRGEFFSSIKIKPTNTLADSGLSFWISLTNNGTYKEDYLSASIRYVSGSYRLSLMRITGNTRTEITYLSLSNAPSNNVAFYILVSRTNEKLWIGYKKSGYSWETKNIDLGSLGGFEIPRTFSIGTHSELRCSILSSDLNYDNYSKIYVNDVSRFPSSGTVDIEGEAISYSSKGSNYLVISRRGVSGTTISSHTKGAAVSIQNEYIRYNDIHCYQIGPTFNTEDLIKRIVTRAGVESNIPKVFQWTRDNSLSIWKSYTNATLDDGATRFGSTEGTAFSSINGSDVSAEAVIDLDSSNNPYAGFILWGSDPSTIANCSRYEVIYKDNDSGDNEIILRQNGSEIYTIPLLSVVSPDKERMHLKVTADRYKITFAIDHKMVFEYPLGSGWYPCGYIGIVGKYCHFYHFSISEFMNPAISFAWDIEETADSALKKFFQGRIIFFKESADGTMVISRFATKDDLGTWNNSKISKESVVPDDRYWMSGITMWGGETWVPMVDSEGIGTRWEKVDAPYLGSEQLLREEAARYIIISRSFRDGRIINSVLDPNAEVMDKVTLENLPDATLITNGTFVIDEIKVAVTSESSKMQVKLRKLEDFGIKTSGNSTGWSKGIRDLWSEKGIYWW